MIAMIQMLPGHRMIHLQILQRKNILKKNRQKLKRRPEDLKVMKRNLVKVKVKVDAKRRKTNQKVNRSMRMMMTIMIKTMKMTMIKEKIMRKRKT